ncbi:MAG: hypothetical protein C0594_05290 [Marinilabiliales bacterium]|nr:MAG: hypothetical protein C0594_05290 [Marinilabiliales bacterium]
MKYEKIVQSYIESTHKLGDQSGSSGHLSFQSYTIHSIDYEKQGDTIKILAQYSVFTETEFTYYPDNPPYEDEYRVKLLCSDQGEIIEADNTYN